jgi:hypothetical protein
MTAEMCVYCRTRPQHERWRPFCSERCKQLDLAAWIDGAYRIPGPPVSLPDEPGTGEEPPDPTAR